VTNYRDLGYLKEPLQRGPISLVHQEEIALVENQASAAGLNQVEQFVWCGDGDDAGRILRDDMVKLLGAARFYFVEWPEGVKDADQRLLDVGVAALLPRTRPQLACP
jgi:hypothetical protein